MGADLNNDERRLLELISTMRDKLDDDTVGSYARVNPFVENTVDWHARGERFVSCGSVLYDSATLIGSIDFGESLWIGPFCMLDGSGGLSVGDHSVFATGVHVYTHDSVRYALSGGLADHERSPVKIGRCCFFGAQSVVTRGVTIGDHVLVCANATVTHDVPSFSIVAGSPARTIGRVHVDGEQVELEYYRDDE